MALGDVFVKPREFEPVLMTTKKEVLRGNRGRKLLGMVLFGLSAGLFS